MKVKLSATALNSDQFGVSDGATAATASSVLHDIGKITDTDHSHKESRIRTDLKRTPNEEICGLYFDSRKDNTLFVEKEPGTTYIGHVSPFASSSTDMTPSIISHLPERVISLKMLQVNGCDGIVTNTGWKNGIIRQLELHVGRPLQWSVCLLHFN
ncbi:hypothetical protein PR048_028453 [Dryococelus australis]|uniref:Uncharacterized protein n=1 Tax=Dryococelus australis TaxID=614101 RepID=A0ABQ9GBB6_9NEOP|nr:hypothetical protein PR048_028453 [Dryococelus australis]